MSEGPIPDYDTRYKPQAILNRSFDDTANALKTISGLSLNAFDYVIRSVDSATETWTFKTGGASGTVTNTIVIVYTDTTLETILTVTKT
jgi:hypothetical protein